MPEPIIPSQAPSHPLVKLAVIAVETYVREHRIMPAPWPLGVDQRQRKAVFVTIIKQQQLRGSLGSIQPLTANLATETITNAIGAAVRDPRFTPIGPAELADLRYVVDLVEAIEPLASLADHDPATCGLLVRSGRKAGVALPQTLGIASAADQLALALRKATLDPTDHYRLHRLSIKRLI